MGCIKIILLLFLVSEIHDGQGAKVLIVVQFPVSSHLNIILPVINSLATRGHQVTVLTGRSLPESTPANVTELLMDMNMQAVGRPGEHKETPYSLIFRGYSTIADILCKIWLEHPVFKKLISSEESFDLAVIDAYIGECLFPLAHIFSAPLVLFTPSIPFPWNNAAIGNPNNYNVDWQFFLMQSPTSGGSLNFIDRAASALIATSLHLYRDLVKIPDFDSLVRLYYPQGENIPSILDQERNASLLLGNTHSALTGVRPNVPAYIDIAGIHCVPSKPLPKNLEEFVSIDDGFIFISFGSTINTNVISESVRQKLVNVFRSLPQRVLWKWDSNVTDLPPNVKTSKWLPQQDILGHKRLRVFITQGGAMSLQEAVYHGVPILGFPIIVDQFPNIQRAVDAGVAISLDLKEASEEEIYSALTRLINEPGFQNNMKRLSGIFRDQPQTPLERTVEKLEMVIRHKGAPFLQSAGRNLWWFQYFLLDIIGTLIIVTTTIVVMLWLSVKVFVSYIRSTKEKTA